MTDELVGGLTPKFRAALFDDRSPEVVLFRLTLNHSSFAAPERFVANTEDIVSDGSYFSAAAFSIVAPGETEGGVTPGGITIENVSRTLLARLRTIKTPLLVTMDAVLASAPDVVEWDGWSELKMVNASWNDLWIESQLIPSWMGDVIVPAKRMGPATFPALYG